MFLKHVVQDWAVHKRACRPAVAQNPHQFAVTANPNQTISVTAIYFPVNEEKPRLISIECIPPADLSVGPCPSPIIEGWFPHGRPSSLTLTQGLNQESLRFPLQVYYDAEALSRSHPINRSVYRITSGQAPRPWHGAVVVLKYSGTRRQCYADASLNDLPALSAYFLGYN